MSEKQPSSFVYYDVEHKQRGIGYFDRDGRECFWYNPDGSRVVWSDHDLEEYNSRLKAREEFNRMHNATKMFMFWEHIKQGVLAKWSLRGAEGFVGKCHSWQGGFDMGGPEGDYTATVIMREDVEDGRQMYKIFKGRWGK